MRGGHLSVAILWLLVDRGCAAYVSAESCTSSFPGDTKVAQCAAFCKAKTKSAHCPRCQCKLCDFCSASPPLAAAAAKSSVAAAAKSAAAAPSTPLSSSPASAAPAKACASTFFGDAKVETCAPWCSAKSKTAHCPRCSCRRCDLCGKWCCCIAIAVVEIGGW